MATIQKIREEPTMTFNSNIPAKLIVCGREYDVVIENAEMHQTKYDYGTDNYLDVNSKCMVHGEVITTETFVCKRIKSEMY